MTGITDAIAGGYLCPGNQDTRLAQVVIRATSDPVNVPIIMLESDLIILADSQTFGQGIEGAVDRCVAMTRAAQPLWPSSSLARRAILHPARNPPAPVERRN